MAAPLAAQYVVHYRGSAETFKVEGRSDSDVLILDADRLGILRVGVQMGLVSAPPTGEPASGPLTQAQRETNRYYIWDVLDTNDPWIWDLFIGAAAARKNTFSLEGVDLTPGSSARLQVYLQGGSDAIGVVDHHVEVSLNSVLVGQATFDGMKPFLFEADVPAEQLRDFGLSGLQNELSIRNLGDTGVSSRFFLDRVALSYPRRLQAVAGRFDGSFAQGGSAAVTGLSSLPSVIAVRPDGVDCVRDFQWDPASLRFAAQPGVRYLAASPQGLLSAPIAIAAASRREENAFSATPSVTLGVATRTTAPPSAGSGGSAT